MRHDSITVRTDGLVSGSIYNQLRSPTLQALLVADKSAAHAAKPHPCPNSLACAKDYYDVHCAQCSNVMVRVSLSMAQRPQLYGFQRCLHIPYSRSDGLTTALATISQPCLTAPCKPLCCRRHLDGSRTCTFASWLQACSRHRATPCILSISIDQK
jgi:hypothetical protein